MTCWVVIPIRVSPEAKSRLAGVLDASARAALVEAMLARAIQAAQGARNVSRVFLLGPDEAPEGIEVLADPGGGLNAAAASALADARASRVIFVHADLPLVKTQDVELLAAAPEGEIAIAPDRHGRGTNALSLPLPEARGFAFAFGPDSFARHTAEAARLGLKIEEVRSPGLARDVDEPDDLADAAALIEQGLK